MRFYDLALFLFIFNLTMGLFNELGVLPGITFQKETWGYEVQEGNVKYVKISNDSLFAGDSITQDLGFYAMIKMIMNGIKAFIVSFGKATILFPLMLAELKVPNNINLVLTSVVWFIYFAGLLQWWTGRSVEGVA